MSQKEEESETKGEATPTEEKKEEKKGILATAAAATAALFSKDKKEEKKEEAKEEKMDEEPKPEETNEAVVAVVVPEAEKEEAKPEEKAEPEEPAVAVETAVVTAAAAAPEPAQPEEGKPAPVEEAKPEDEKTESEVPVAAKPEEPSKDETEIPEETKAEPQPPVECKPEEPAKEEAPVKPEKPSAEPETPVESEEPAKEEVIETLPTVVMEQSSPAKPEVCETKVEAPVEEEIQLPGGTIEPAAPEPVDVCGATIGADGSVEEFTVQKEAADLAMPEEKAIPEPTSEELAGDMQLTGTIEPPAPEPIDVCGATIGEDGAIQEFTVKKNVADLRAEPEAPKDEPTEAVAPAQDEEKAIPEVESTPADLVGDMQLTGTLETRAPEPVDVCGATIEEDGTVTDFVVKKDAAELAMPEEKAVPEGTSEELIGDMQLTGTIEPQAPKTIDVCGATIGEDGTVSEFTVKKKVAELEEAKPQENAVPEPTSEAKEEVIETLPTVLMEQSSTAKPEVCEAKVEAPVEEEIQLPGGTIEPPAPEPIDVCGATVGEDGTVSDFTVKKDAAELEQAKPEEKAVPEPTSEELAGDMQLTGTIEPPAPEPIDVCGATIGEDGTVSEFTVKKDAAELEQPEGEIQLEGGVMEPEQPAVDVCGAKVNPDGSVEEFTVKKDAEELKAAVEAVPEESTEEKESPVPKLDLNSAPAGGPTPPLTPPNGISPLPQPEENEATSPPSMAVETK